MGGIARGHDLPKSQEGKLPSEQIVELFGARRDRLSTLKSAKRFSADDLAFLSETEEVLKALEVGDQTSFNVMSSGLVKSLRSLVNGANAAMSRAESVTDDVPEEEKSKAVTQAPEDFGAAELGEADVPEGEVSPLLAQRKQFEHIEAAKWWFDEALGVDRAIAEAEAAQGKSRKHLSAAALDAYRATLDAFSRYEVLIQNAGYTIQHYPFLVVIASALDAFADRLHELHNPPRAEGAMRKLPENAERIGEEFNQRIETCQARVHAFASMSLSTLERVEIARGEKDALWADIKALKTDWNTSVQPMLDVVKKQREDGRLGPKWGGLAKRYGQLFTSFRGVREKRNEQGEIIRPAEDGALQMMGRKISERSREIRQEAWEQDFPAFAVNIAGLRVRMQDARLREGDERVQAFGLIQDDVREYSEQWEVLRAGGPAPRHDRKGRIVHSTVREYDISLHQVKKDLVGFVKHATEAKPTPLDRAAFAWRGALLDTEQFWNPETKFFERLAFLRRYGSGEATEKDIEHMVPEYWRESFMVTAQSDVLKELRARGAVSRERAAEIEREIRSGLLHPELQKLRLEAKDTYRDAVSAMFWKDSVRQGIREKLLAKGVEIENVDLQKYVEDIEEYRKTYHDIAEAYARAKQVEDRVYDERPDPEGSLNVIQLGAILKEYARVRESVGQAWDAALHDPASKIPIGAHAERLYEWLRKFQAEGTIRQSIPGPLRKTAIGWILARSRLRITGNYTQWSIENNPKLSRGIIKYIPKEFFVPRVAVGEMDERTWKEEYLKNVLGLPLPEPVLSEEASRTDGFGQTGGEGEEQHFDDETLVDDERDEAALKAESASSRAVKEDIGEESPDMSARDLAIEKDPRMFIKPLAE